jgi:hypothetical protein
MSEIDYDTVPVGYMAMGLLLYVEQGVEPGGFMRALLSNDLRGAIASADGTNIARIPHWVSWMENNLPSGSWGSAANYQGWVMRCGLAGQARAA